ncbi:MAG: hypothetical protein V7719_00075 [Psychroserpens sp.]|uniref:hypothetical protein n=1 Tax=Psychroserpens sp. TaxID=2020870 RepID=UPI0030038473
MKFLSTVAVTLLVTCSSFAQSQAEITKHAQVYFDYMTNLNLDSVLDYMHPKVFEMASREQMKAGMEQMFNSEEMKIEFISNDVTSVTDEKEVDGVTYAAVFYNSEMKMTFVSEMDKPEEDRKGFLEHMKTTMDAQFGEGNVTSDLKTMSLIITLDSNMFAIKDPKYKGWKFIGNDDSMKQLVDTVIPESIRTELLNEK